METSKPWENTSSDDHIQIDESKRKFLVYSAATMASLLVPSVVKASEPIDPPIDEDPEGPIDTGEVNTIQEYIDELNYGCELLNVRLEPGFAPGQPCDNLDQIYASIETNGGLVNVKAFEAKVNVVSVDVPALVEVMRQFGASIKKIYKPIPSLQIPFLSYTRRGITYYFEPIPDGSGYTSISQNLNDATSQPEYARGRKFNNAYEAIDFCIPVDDPWENSLSKALNKYMRYDPNIVQLATCEGFYPNIFDTTVQSPLDEIYGLLRGVNNIHTLYSNSYFAKTFRNRKYSGHQYSSADLDIAMIDRYEKVTKGESFTPLVLSDPNSIIVHAKVQRFTSIYKDADPNTMKVLHMISTPNQPGKVELAEALPKGMIVCSTVDSDENGYFLPERRSYIEQNPDNFFLFPDHTSVLDADLCVEVKEDGSIKASHELYGTGIAGASFSTARGAAFFSSILNEWLTRGNEYSYDKFMSLIHELCPIVEIRSEQFGIIKGRVPNIEKIDEWFRLKTLLPQIGS